MSCNSLYKIRKKYVLPIAAIAMTVLIVLSPCSVRETIQSQLDAPVAKRLNPSKTTLNAGQQCAYGESVAAGNQARGVELPGGFPAPAPHFELPAPYGPTASSFAISSDWFISAKIPIYILYRRMKTWI